MIGVPSSFKFYNIKIFIIHIMTSVLLRQFTNGRIRTYGTEYVKMFGMKSPRALNSVIPDLTSNLSDASNAFIEALVNLDEEFVQSTSTKALQNVLIPQIQRLKASQTSIKIIDWSQEAPEATNNEEGKKGTLQKALSRMLISPYVIFGQTMEERAQLDDPWKSVHTLFTTNRFLAMNQGFSLKDVMNKQIFGFHCHWFDSTQGYQVTEGVVRSKHAPQELRITFETNSDNHEFFVSDFNDLLTFSS